jgi:hypothetical protein
MKEIVMASQARVRPSWKKFIRRSAIYQIRRNQSALNRLTKKVMVLEKAAR